MAEYTSDAVVSFGGCVDFTIVRRYAVLYPVGSKVYIKHKANKGILESVVIKKISRALPGTAGYGVFYAINYVDTFNEVWLEEELIPFDDAQALAIAYWEGVIADAEAGLLENCNIVVD